MWHHVPRVGSSASQPEDSYMCHLIGSLQPPAWALSHVPHVCPTVHAQHGRTACWALLAPRQSADTAAATAAAAACLRLSIPKVVPPGYALNATDIYKCPNGTYRSDWVSQASAPSTCTSCGDGIYSEMVDDDVNPLNSSGKVAAFPSACCK